MDALLQDVRYAARRLRANPGFTGVAVLTLALGIGANTAVFSVLRSVLLQPLPYAAPDRIAMVWNSWRGWEQTWLSDPEVLDYRAGVSAFEHLAAYATSSANLTGDGEPERVAAARLTANIFPALGIGTAVGRGFDEAEDRPGAEPVVVLGHGLWQRRFGGDASIVGRTIRVNGTPRTVVGVLAPGVRLPLEFEAERPAEVWVPLQLNTDEPGSRGSHYLYGVARLRGDATVARANDELEAVARGWVDQGTVPAEVNFLPFAKPIDDVIFGSVRPALLILVGAVTFVLLIACANVANLLLARGDGRRAEMAIRSSLGAGRSRLIAQLLAESLLLALAGGAAGVALAFAALQGIVALDPVGIPRVGSVTIDATTLGYTLLVALGTGLVFGIVPALQLAGARPTSVQLASLLREGGRSTVGRARQRFRRSLVVAELALSVVLVIGAALMIRSFVELRRIDLGYDPDDMLTLRLALPTADYGEPARVVEFYRELQRRVEELPGVERAGFVRLLPLTGTIGDWSISIEGREPVPHENTHGDWQVVTPGYFETMRMQLVAGRFLEPGDHERGMPAVVINETMARAYWPDGDALGRRFRQGTLEQPYFTIVGIVADVRHNAAVEDAREEMYHPHAQYPLSVGFAPQAMTLVVRTRGRAPALVPQIRAQVRALDASVPIAEVQTMRDVVSAAFSRPRFTTWLLGAFAALALALAAIGVFGVVSYGVSQRTHEIGLRMALGARRADVLRLIMRGSAVLALTGIALGVAAAAALSRLLRTLVYGVSTLDPATFIIVPAVLVAVVVAASFIPARRASRLDPQQALR